MRSMNCEQITVYWDSVLSQESSYWAEAKQTDNTIYWFGSLDSMASSRGVATVYVLGPNIHIVVYCCKRSVCRQYDYINLPYII